jgi:hypothetical protein
VQPAGAPGESNVAARETMDSRLLSLRLLLPCAALAAAGIFPVARPVAAPAQQDSAALSGAEIRALVGRVISNQHRNDEAIAEFERFEHRLSRKKEDARPDEDRLYRVVPTGTGTLKLVVEENGQPVGAEFYRKQLRDLEQALVWALDPQETRQKHRVQKWERRRKERRETVDAARDGFVFTWGGWETRNGRSLVRLLAEPNPAFRSASRNTDLFRHARGAIWVDPESAQLARLEADLASDFSIGAGVLGKVYRGGRFVIEQAEAAPGVWLPTRIQYDFRGRKFVFGFELHEITETARYRRIGPPQEALAAVRAELRAGNGAPSSN